MNKFYELAMRPIFGKKMHNFTLILIYAKVYFELLYPLCLVGKMALNQHLSRYPGDCSSPTLLSEQTK